MSGSVVCLRLFTTERQKHDGELLYEWLLERAKALGIPGGSAFRAIAGYGRHGTLHEEGFFELAADLPIQVEFVVAEPQARLILNLLDAEKLRIFWVLTPATAGISAS